MLLKLLPTSLLMLFLLTSAVVAQSERLGTFPNGDKLFKDEGQQYYGMTLDHARDADANKKLVAEIPVLKAENANLQQQIANLTAQLADKDKIIDVRGQQLALVNKLDSQYQMVLLNQQAELKRSADILAMGKPDWVDRLVNKWPVKLTLKLGLPALGGAANVRELIRPNPFNPPKGSIVQEPCR